MAFNITDTGIVLQSQKLGIGGSPVDTAKLDIQSTTEGLLVPRMTETQRDLIVDPASSLFLFNITSNQFEWWDSVGENWVAVGGGTDDGITQLTGDVTAGPGNASQVATIANNAVTTVKIDDLAVTNAKVATGIDAVKLADGSVSNTEFQYLDGVSSNIQTQLTGKAATGAIGSSGLTMTSSRLLGRTTASTGAVEEITVGSGLSLSAGSLTATGGSIRQIATASSNTDYSTTNTSFTDTNLQITLAGVQSGSKVILYIQGTWATNGANVGVWTVTRDGTNLGDAANGLGVFGGTGIFLSDTKTVYDATPGTGSVTYVVRARTSNAATTVSFGVASDLQRLVAIEIA